MLKVNLLPQKIRQERIGRLRNAILYCGIGVIFVVLGFLYYQQLKVYNQTRKEIDRVDVELNSADLIDKMKLVIAIQEMEQNVKNKMAVLNAIRGDQAAWLTFLDDLSNRMIPEVWLTSIRKGPPKDTSSKNRTVEIEGMSLDKENVINFTRNLQQSPYLNNATLLFVTEKLQGQASVFSFKISSEVKLAIYPDL